MYTIVIIGGGAAGIFAAVAAKRTHPSCQVIVLEKSAVLLSKVRISGGGRCNVTHACFDPKQLVKHYPRGEKELLGPFHRFQPEHTVEWFESRGVKLKTETDGRMFPVSDSSESIIDCLLNEAKELGVDIRTRQKVNRVTKLTSQFQIGFKEIDALLCDRLILATGSSTEGHEWAASLGHSLQQPVPSLFTFNVPTSPLNSLSGISLQSVELQIKDSSLCQLGPLLITHFGFSGPAALKLSAWGARILHQKEYRIELIVNWIPQFSEEVLLKRLISLKSGAPQQLLSSENLFKLPKRLWETFVPHKRLADISLKELHVLAHKLHADPYAVEGKTTHKEEFVTCGGVSLKEVNFKTMESKCCPGLFFAGEILDIDGITGGFNFQNAWTTAFIAGSSV